MNKLNFTSNLPERIPWQPPLLSNHFVENVAIVVVVVPINSPQLASDAYTQSSIKYMSMNEIDWKAKLSLWMAKSRHFTVYPLSLHYPLSILSLQGRKEENKIRMAEPAKHAHNTTYTNNIQHSGSVWLLGHASNTISAF